MAPATADLLPAEAQTHERIEQLTVLHYHSVQALPVSSPPRRCASADSAVTATLSRASHRRRRTPIRPARPRGRPDEWAAGPSGERVDDDTGVTRRRVGDAENRRAIRGTGGTSTPTTTRPSTAPSWATWTSSGARRACARPTPGCSATCAGRRVLEVGCGAAAAARWLATQGARRGRAGPVRRHAAARRAAAAERTGVRVPLVQADALALPLRRRGLRHRLHRVRRGAVRRRLGRGDARGVPGAAPRRPLGLLGHPPDAVDLPRRPGRGRAGRGPLLLRPPALRGARRARASPTYVEQHRTLGDRIRELVGAGFRCVDLVEPEWPDGHEEIWGQWSPLRGRLFPGTAIFVAEKPAQR